MYIIIEIMGQDSLWLSHCNDYGLYICVIFYRSSWHSCRSTFEPKEGDDAYNQQVE